MKTCNVTARVLALASAAVLACAGDATLAQGAFPAKTVRIIVAFPPGQATDIVARLMADELGKLWGRNVIVDNRGGGASIPGTVAGKTAASDGYTLTFATSSSIAVNPAIYPNLPYDPPRDFAMVHATFTVPWVIGAHPSLPYRSVKALVEASRRNPEQLSWGYGATALQLGAELFKLRTGAKITGIPYKGSAQAMSELLGGQIPLLFDTVAASLPHIKAGKMNAIATTTPQRVPLLPGTPTVAEAGFAGTEAMGWGGLVVPKATPTAIVEKLGADVRRVLADPAMQQKISERGMVPDLRGPEEWTKFVHSELEKWIDVARKANVKAE